MDRTRKATGKQPRRKALNRREEHDKEDGWTESNLRARMKETTSSKELDLAHMFLEQIPPGVFSIKDIEILDVSDNPLGFLPVNIASLSNLKEMRAAGCGIREISGNISRCTYLSKVDLSRNPSITTLPVTMKQLRYLKHVVLSGCELTSLPQNLTLLAMIETLDLSNNELTNLPPEISELKRLKVLILSDNAFESIPAPIESLGHLHCLEMKRNKLENNRGGQTLNVPSHLKILDMEGNYSLKVLPEGLENLENLEELNISYCGIKTLPDSIGKLASIRRIHLAGNKLRTLPAGIGNLLNLETLDLEGNRRLSGLPLSLYHLRKKLKDKQTGTNIGFILDNCPGLALPESEIAQGNVVSVLVELLSEDVLKKATAIVAAEVVEYLIIEGLIENIVAETEGCIWDDLMPDVTNIAISDKECSLDIFQEILEEVMPVPVKEIIIESINEERVMATMTEELLEETTRSMTEEVATDAVMVDDMAREVNQKLLEEVPNAMLEGMARNTLHEDDVIREVMEDMLEEAKTTLRNEVATDAVQVDVVTWEVMRETLEDAKTMVTMEVATEAVRVDAVAWEVMGEMLEEVKTMMAMEVASEDVRVEETALEVMGELLEEVTEAMTISIASKENKEWRLAMAVIEDLLEEFSKENSKPVVVGVDSELRLGQTVPDKYDTQFSYQIPAAADDMQYVDLLAGCRLSVPRGATDEDISVISAVMNPHGYDQTIDLQDDELLVSDIIEMRPAGMKFSKPVKLKIAHSLPKFFCEKEFFVKTSENQGRSWMTLDTVSHKEKGQWFVTVEVSHFSEFVAVARPLEHCHEVEKRQASTLDSSRQTNVKMTFPKDCVRQNCEINVKVLPVDADTLTCAGMGEDGISGIDSMSHIVKSNKNLNLSSPATIVLPLSPGDQNTQFCVLSCDERGHWEDVTSSVDNIVLQGSKVAFRTNRFKHGFTVLRSGEIEDATRIVNTVIKNIRARLVRLVIFKKWKEPPEEGVMTARIECVLNEMVEDRISCAEQIGFELQPGTPTPPIVMTEGEEFCVTFEGSIRPVENGRGVDYIFYCERPRVLEFDVKLVDNGKGATTKVELYPGRLEKVRDKNPGTKTRGTHVRVPAIQNSGPSPPLSSSTSKANTSPPRRPKPLMTAEITPPTALPVSGHYPVEVDEPGAPVTAAADPRPDSDLVDDPLDESGFRRALSALRHAAEEARHAREDKQLRLEKYRQAASLVEKHITHDDM